MTAGITTAALLAIVAVLTIALPGRDLYHNGWFNVAVVALAVVGLNAGRRAFASATTSRTRAGIAALSIGGAIAALAIAVSGLFLPDTRTIVGAPGSSVPLGDLGATLAFAPFDGPDRNGAVLERRGRAPLRLSAHPRSVGSFVLWTVDRDVVRISARDAGGGALTVTQPSGASFLSPILLMNQHQTIAGEDVAYDSFAVPAAGRIVKAVLWHADTVVFALDDRDGRPVPHGIAGARDGQTVRLAGLQLQAEIGRYPAVAIASAPPLFLVMLAAALVVSGIALTVTGKDRLVEV